MRLTKNSEHQEQKALFDWMASMKHRYPELQWAFAIPNQGGGDKSAMIRGQKMKREGQKKGVPDILVPVARQGLCGLFIELKVKGNYATIEQLAWHEFLASQGYAVSVCYGWEHASRNICNYLDGRWSF